MADNPPAFPCEAQADRSVPPAHDYIQTGIYSAKFPGMSLRDWFAGQLAAAEVASAGANYDAAEALADAASEAGMSIPQRIAFNAYEVADAMLAARAPTVDPAPAQPPAPKEPYVPDGGWPAEHTGEPSCICTECIPF